MKLINIYRIESISITNCPWQKGSWMKYSEEGGVGVGESNFIESYV